MQLDERDAIGLARALQVGELSCVDVAKAVLAKIGDDELRAWVVVDDESLIASARTLDALDPGQRAARPLYGVPVAIKDNFDTEDLPTEYGSPIYSGHQPAADAAAVQKLREAGALIVGKVKLAELAWMHPPDTISPIDPDRTPGGSSTGSAVAVAAGHVPVAIGTQTAGSVNRPASYCGVVGYKPTRGLIDTTGIKPNSKLLDTVGVFSQTVADARLVAQVLMTGPRMLGGAGGGRVVFARTPAWDRVELEARLLIESVIQDLCLEEVKIPDTFLELLVVQEEIQLYDGARALGREYEERLDLLSDEINEAIADGAAISDSQNRRNLEIAKRHSAQLTQLLSQYDGILVPSTTGVPPKRRDFTGDPVFSRAWNLGGAPSISLPLAWTDDILPVGLQLVGAPHMDVALLNAAARLYPSS